ncbi:hypothetical protein STXM2123_503 [Streptomyces sp. F-3]|nr:hypothetical protein STXM2123_503 [Streptomyces sp. F-3]
MEPVRVIRSRRTDALAELIQAFKEAQEREREAGDQHAARSASSASAEDTTEELPPVPPAPSTPPPEPPPRGSVPRSAPDWTPAGAGRGLRRAAVAVAIAAAALIGFGCALLLPVRGEAGAAPAARPSGGASAAPAVTVTATVSVDPDGPGTLREGDTGPDVVALQRRLLRIPDVYRDGSVDGRYDSTLKEAVARFQLWYGISGDERGVYGDDTRRALESRTALDHE